MDLPSQAYSVAEDSTHRKPGSDVKIGLVTTQSFTGIGKTAVSRPLHYLSLSSSVDIYILLPALRHVYHAVLTFNKPKLPSSLAPCKKKELQSGPLINKQDYNLRMVISNTLKITVNNDEAESTPACNTIICES